MKRVVVTGANGHLGYTLVRLLMERGYSVRATVRDPEDHNKVAPLRKLGAKLVRAELSDPASLEKALQGMEGLFQVAAVFNLTSSNPEEEVFRPNIEGTRNIMEAARKAGIKRMIYTSSIASVGTIAPGEEPLDESSWNDHATEPYALSKTRSEQLAWELAKKYGIPMMAVLPGTIIGPDFFRITSSLQLVKDVVDGKVPMAFPISLSYVDVRDVALAHILVYESAEAEGRYIATDATLSMAETCRMIKKIRPQTKVSDKVMPAWIVRMLPPLDYLLHKVTGAPRQMKKEMIDDYLNRSQAYRSTRMKELGWSPRSVENSFQETIDWMVRPELSFFNGKAKSQKT